MSIRSHRIQDIAKATDEELTHLLRTGSHPAFEQIYQRYKGLLIAHAYKKLGVFEDAKEIVQDVFTKIWVNHTSTPELNNLGGWLYVLVRNRVLKHIEHQQVVSRYESSFREFTSQEHHMADLAFREKEMKDLIAREIDALPPKMKHVFLMSRNEHLSNKDIAKQLNISEHTVKNHIKAALKILRERLGMVLTLMV